MRLAGDDAEVRAIAREAVAVASDRELFARLRQLNGDRMRWIAALASRAARPTPPAPARGSRLLVVAWGTVLAVGLTAALVFAVMMDAPHRKNRFIEPETSIQLAMTVAPVAVILLAIVALARVPKAADAAIAETGSVLVLLVVLWVIGYRQVAGVDDSRDFAAADLAAWMPVAAVIAALLLAIVVRCDARRRRTPTWASRPRRAPERIADRRAADAAVSPPRPSTRPRT